MTSLTSWLVYFTIYLLPLSGMGRGRLLECAERADPNVEIDATVTIRIAKKTFKVISSGLVLQ